jgi:hypothetical protein
VKNLRPVQTSLYRLAPIQLNFSTKNYSRLELWLIVKDIKSAITVLECLLESKPLFLTKSLKTPSAVRLL